MYVTYPETITLHIMMSGIRTVA